MTGSAAARSIPRPRSRVSADAVARVGLTAAACSILVILGLIVLELLKAARPAWRTFGPGFLTSTQWDPVAGHFGALPFLFGTLVTTALAIGIAAPLGLGSAIFLTEIAPVRLAAPLGFCIELLAAVPSVVYGLLGIFVLVPVLRDVVGPALRNTMGFLPLFQGPYHGQGFLTGGVVLAIMIVPFITAVSREALLAVPREQREAALAVGATRWESTRGAVVPFAAVGIAGSVFLAVARALGETMAVTMVIGNSPKISGSLFAPGYTIAAVIANEFTEAVGDVHLSALSALGLVLFAVTLVVNALARLLLAYTVRRQGGTA